MKGVEGEWRVRLDMRGQSSTRSVEHAILGLASKQHGVVSRAQLLAHGVSRGQIERRLGALVEIHRGVYRAGAVPAAHTHEMAALLASSPDAVLSHRSASALWELLPYPASAPVWITVPPGRRVDRAGITAIRAKLDRRDIRRRLHMSVTSPPRTVFDLAALLNLADLEQLVAEANFRKLAREAELRKQIERNSGCRGVAALRNVLDLPSGPQRTRSGGERELLRLLRAHGIEGFQTNAVVCGYEVDFLWREFDFAVELDGWDGHSGRVAFERDRLKTARLNAGGIRVMPVTGRQLRYDRDGVVQRLLAALEAARRQRRRSRPAEPLT